MKNFISALIGAITIFATTARCADQPTGKQTATAIRGTWRVADSEQTVKITETNVVHRFKAPPGFMPPFFYIGANAEMGSEKDATGNYVIVATYSYVLRTGADQMEIDLTVLDAKGTKYLFKGICESKSDRLRICYSTPGNDRPKAFVAEQNGCTLLSLQRETK